MLYDHLTILPQEAIKPMVQTLTLEHVQRAAIEIQERARQAGAKVAICFVDEGGHPVYALRMDGAAPASFDASLAKAKCAALYRRSTAFFEKTVTEGRAGMMTLPDLVAASGGVPISVAGRCIGAIGVAGAKSSDDAALADAGAAILDSLG